ncbi:GNAT family N-acetyltransferase [Psychrobacter sp. I-STPA6b]|uniref:GNAT family N-acetyltransferase n=1 Tax=Psychrobacter sp. I-STPA6b TaxID=2585718 RepID=UPI001D0C5C7C|nr:GNAT family N-acetyltransferase [Psychrobacter sp. I-STPA6b]
MSVNVQIRAYQDSDTPILASIYDSAIMAIDDAIYDAKQKRVWRKVAFSAESVEQFWHTRFAQTQPLVAINKHQQPIAFIEFLPNINHLGEQVRGQGYIDCLYVHPNYQRQGVAQQLLDAVFKTVMITGVYEPEQTKSTQSQIIWVHASRGAVPLFEHNGFEKVTSQIVQRHGVELENFIMKKKL